MDKTIKYAIFCLAFLALSCNETPVEIPPFGVQDTKRVVLVEYLTGVKCPNCPKGTVTLNNLAKLYPDNLAIVAIHGRLLTDPLSTSKFDFRNEFSRQLEESYRPFFGKPAVMINRVKFPEEPNKAVDFVDLWPGYIAKQINQAQTLDIVSDIKVNTETKQISVNTGVIPKENISGILKISIYVTEGGIVDAQESVGSIIPNYNHEHILRHMMTAFDGDALASNPKANDIINKSYSYTVPSTLKLENLEIIIAVSNGQTNEVYQASLTKL
jgi:thiol-disulfide isomerase/thioredoxin